METICPTVSGWDFFAATDQRDCRFIFFFFLNTKRVDNVDSEGFYVQFSGSARPSPFLFHVFHLMRLIDSFISMCKYSLVSSYFLLDRASLPPLIEYELMLLF